MNKQERRSQLPIQVIESAAIAIASFLLVTAGGDTTRKDIGEKYTLIVCPEPLSEESLSIVQCEYIDVYTQR